MTLRNKYDELMEEVHLSSEKQEEILKNIAAADLKPKKRFFARYGKQLTAAAAVLLLATVLIPQVQMRSAVVSQDSAPEGLALTSAAEEVPDAKTLKKDTGLTFTEPKLPFEITSVSYLNYGDMAEVIYTGTGNEAVYRISSGEEDNSGDYTEYQETEEREISGVKVRVSIDQDGNHLAVWSKDGESYSLCFTTSVSEEEMNQAVESTLE